MESRLPLCQAKFTHNKYLHSMQQLDTIILITSPAVLESGLGLESVLARLGLSLGMKALGLASSGPGLGKVPSTSPF